MLTELNPNSKSNTNADADGDELSYIDVERDNDKHIDTLQHGFSHKLTHVQLVGYTVQLLLSITVLCALEEQHTDQHRHRNHERHTQQHAQ